MLHRLGSRLAAVILSVASVGAVAADRDDIYLELSAGPLLRSQTRGQILGTFNGGYLFWDSLGLGIGLDQSLSASEASALVLSWQGFTEVRWFLEPVELFGAVGFQRAQSAAGDLTTRVIFAGGGAYLWALTESLSLSLVGRAQFHWREQSRLAFLVGAGGRLLF